MIRISSLGNVLFANPPPTSITLSSEEATLDEGWYFVTPLVTCLSRLCKAAGNALIVPGPCYSTYSEPCCVGFCQIHLYWAETRAIAHGYAGGNTALRALWPQLSEEARFFLRAEHYRGRNAPSWYSRRKSEADW